MRPLVFDRGADTMLCAHADLPDDLKLTILQLLPLDKSKLALMSLGKAWHAAMAHPKVHKNPHKLPMPEHGVYRWQQQLLLLDIGPTPPKLQDAIFAVCTSLAVTFDMR